MNQTEIFAAAHQTLIARKGEIENVYFGGSDHMSPIMRDVLPAEKYEGIKREHERIVRELARRVGCCVS